MSKNVTKSAPKPKLWRSCRMYITLCGFLAAVQSSMLRDDLGIALVCMSKPPGNLTNDNINDAVVPTLPWLTNKKNGEFDWDSTTRGRILGAFLYGYISTTMVGGFMSNRYGTKIPFMWSGIGNTIFHFLCPTAVLVHTELFFVCRIFQGMFAGLMAGPMFQLFGSWMSEEEASTLLSFGFSGFTFGTVIIYPMSGLLCSQNINGFGGWPLIFYVPAIITILFVIFWSIYLHDVPENHPFISQEEYDYLLQNVDISDEPLTIPWKSIFTSMPFIAYILCYAVFLWNIFTMMNNMPLFMQTMFGISSNENGYLYCIPFTFTFISRIFNGKTYPIVKNSLGLSNTICRKLYVIFGISMIIMSFLSIIFVENVTKLHVVCVLTVNLAVGDFAYTGGFFPTLLDLAPNYAGLLSGISTFIGFLVACPSTLVNSILIKQNTKDEWNTVLWIMVAMFTFSMIFYVLFGSATLQSWSIGLDFSELRASRSTLLLTQSYAAARSMSMKRPTHVF